MLIDPFYDNVQFALFTSSKIIPWDKFNKNDQILKVIANSNTRQIPDAKVDLNMDDFEKHRSTLVGVSQKVAWLGIGHPRLGSTSPAKDLDPTLWAAVVGLVSQEQILVQLFGLLPTRAN